MTDPVRPAPGAVLTGHTDRIRSLVFTADGRRLVSASSDGAHGQESADYSNSTIRLWPVAGAQRTAAIDVVPSGVQGTPAFSPNSTMLAAGFPTTIWGIGRPRSDAQLGRIPTFNQGGQAVAFSPDGRWIVSGDPLVRWDVQDPREPRTLDSGIIRTNGSSSVTYGPDGRTVATTDLFSPVRLWRPDGIGPNPTTTLPGSTSGNQGVSYASDGASLATLTDGGQAAVWDVSDPDAPVRQSLLGNADDRVDSVAFGSGVDLLVTGTASGTLTVWDVSDRMRPHTISSVRRHAGAVGGLAAQPDGDLLASAGADGHVLLWSLHDPDQPLELTTFVVDGPQFSPVLAFSPNGAMLAASIERQVIVWDTDVPGILQRICARTARIDDAEWARYLPGSDFDPPCA